jgi:succinylarginine dihydrolase
MTPICNFDGLVGATHNYAGLSTGNIASTTHKNTVSNPQAAALQGLAQMRLVYDIVGIQGFLPPHLRPNFEFLYRQGFGSHEAKALAMAYTKRPDILAAAWSASPMWTANAATVTMTNKNHVHITPANLLTMRHRHQELEQTTKNLRHIFYNDDYFTHHTAGAMPDEGAANAMTIVGNTNKVYDIFVYSPQKTNYPARQSLGALTQIAREHHCKNPIFLEQSVVAVNSGAFHNDVVAVSHENCLIYHEYAFGDDGLLPDDIFKIKISDTLLSLAEAVKTYLFNMRIVTDKQGDYVIIASTEVQESKNALKAVDFIIEKNPKIKHIHYMDLKQSMANGGGSACLRLRVPLINTMAVHQAYLLDDDKFVKLTDFIKNNYRDRIVFDDLRDIDFANQTLSTHNRFQEMIADF